MAISSQFPPSIRLADIKADNAAELQGAARDAAEMRLIANLGIESGPFPDELVVTPEYVQLAKQQAAELGANHVVPGLDKLEAFMKENAIAEIRVAFADVTPETSQLAKVISDAFAAQGSFIK